MDLLGCLQKKRQKYMLYNINLSKHKKKIAIIIPHLRINLRTFVPYNNKRQHL